MTGLRLVLAGAAIGNGNRGVEALARSIADSVDRESPGGMLTILDDGWGIRSDASGRYGHCAIEYVGVRRSRRWHRPESWAQVRAAQRLAPQANPVARRIAAADAVLDISAGDSFTDLYGTQRLKTVTAPKQAAIRANRPLVLLPQTYGPFRERATRRIAERLVRSAALAYARDPWSYDRLLELAGQDADRTRLRSGVDVAFALQPRRPVAEIAAQLPAWQGTPVAGVNVSGLLANEEARQRHHIAGDYLGTMTALVRELIRLEAMVVLVPHVHTPGGNGESDHAAIERVRAALSPKERDRTIALTPQLDAAEIKWCISGMDWFVGTRMHSTIAALSVMTPACGYAYSDKTQGVFDTCGLGDGVIDARSVTGQDAVHQMVGSFLAREQIRGVLAEHVPTTIEASRHQLRDIFSFIEDGSAARMLGWRR